jgi:hypothetical protein
MQFVKIRAQPIIRLWSDYIVGIPDYERKSIIIFSSLSVSTFLIWLLLWNQPPVRPDRVDLDHIKHTKEYQITLKQVDWSNREAALDIWIAKFNSLFPLMKVNKKGAFERIFLQRGLRASGSNHCKISGRTHTRVREYLSGPYTGQTLDIKHSGYPWEVCGLPFWPSETWYANASQKCEQDIHPCFSKNSRVTKFFFKDVTPIKYCSDLIELLPDAFGSLSEYERHANKPRQKGVTYIYVWEYQSIVYDNLKVIFSFDIKYHSYDSALAGKRQPANGEFSIRIYPELDGANPVWNSTWVKEIDNFYFNLVLAFDKFSKHIVCAKEYFRTGVHA